MNRIRMLLGFVFAAVAVLALSLVVTAQPKEAASEKAFKPVQSMEEMMEGQKKLYGEIKMAIGEKAWDEGETCAWILAEVANVNHYQRNDPSYQKFADQMSGQCAELAKLLQKRSEAEAKEKVGEIGKTCNACHDQFRKKKRGG